MSPPRPPAPITTNALLASVTADLGFSDTQPRIQLQGPTTVMLAQGSQYQVCPPRVSADVVCDRGALASDDTDGDLTLQVLACANQGPVSGGGGCVCMCTT